jgi:uncharacterized membrane protein YbhN (UPF0104 family)
VAFIAFQSTFVSEALETFVMIELLGGSVSFVQVLTFDSAVGLARSLVSWIPAGLGVQEAGYAGFLSSVGGKDAVGLTVSFLVLKRLREAFYCAVGFVLLAKSPAWAGGARDESAFSRPLRLRLPQPDHADA